MHRTAEASPGESPQAAAGCIGQFAFDMGGRRQAIGPIIDQDWISTLSSGIGRSELVIALSPAGDSIVAFRIRLEEARLMGR